MATHSPSIEVRELTKRYGSTVAVDRLSFDVHPGRVTGFLGPNGAGKSTTLRMILGLDNPTPGSALINGRPFADHRQPLFEVGALLDPKAFHPGRSAENHLRCLALANGIDQRRVDAVLGLGRPHCGGRPSGPAGSRSGWDNASGSPPPCSAIPPS